MSNYWYYGPGADGNTPTLLLTGTEVADATPYVGTVSRNGAWSNSGYLDKSYWPWDGIRSEIKAVLTLEDNPISMTDSSRMISMFSNFSSLVSFDVSGFDTSKVIDISNMFVNCSSIASLDLSVFNTSLVVNMNNVFGGCSHLASIDVSGFDTSKVTYMGNMFKNCSSLASIDVSGFDTSKVTNMSSMFSGCSSLASIDVSGFDTSLVTDMGSMFYSCSSLTSIDLSGFDTSLVTDMYHMFRNCSSLTSLDLSGFDTSKVTNMSNMFSNCSALKIIDISDSMENILPNLPSASYYNVETGESVPRESLTEGTWVRDEADISLVSTMVQNRQAVRSLRHLVNKLSKRIVALETRASSLVQ